ncbi:MAG: hypothetical protein ACD_58C00151G0003 [uncultured bacterium]|nr:MAG: hypothetical protein ACD_58C00151G0003 [uncultured bacterium]
MSLKLITTINKQTNLSQSLVESFKVDKDGIYLIEVTARAKSWWQIFPYIHFRCDGLRVQIDSEIFIEKTSRWHGNNLKGLTKTVVFLIHLNKGQHYIHFIPTLAPNLQQINIYEVTNKIVYEPGINNLAEDGNYYPWYSFIFKGEDIEELHIIASCQNKSSDDDDLQLVIDNKKIKNDDKNVSFWHRYSYWCGKLLNGATKTFSIRKHLKDGWHYLELVADRSPLIDTVYFTITPESQPIDLIKKYKRIDGEDYNRYDKEIQVVVDKLNKEFSKQKYPPPMPLDPNLVKAIAYKESRIGNDKNANIDIMQVWNEENKTPQTIKGLEGFPANEFIFENNYGHMSYNYPKEYLPPKVTKPEESIFWGVRWLYHKAQYLDQNSDGSLIKPYIRKWKSWQKAILDYNANKEIKEKYLDDILNLYEKGNDLYRPGKKLWSIFGLMLVGSFIFLQLNNYLGSPNTVLSNLISINIEGQGQVKGIQTELIEDRSQLELIRLLEQKMEEAIEKYPVEVSENRKLFKPIIDLIPQNGVDFQWVFDQYTDELVEKSENLKQFIEAASTIQIIRSSVWEVADFDGDGENELVFLQDDDLNNNYIWVYLMDRYYTNKYQLVEYKMSDSYFSSINSSIMPDKPLSILDLTGDLTPEILVFSNGGRYGSCLTVFQYNKSMAVLQFFDYSKVYYPEYVFTDSDYDNQMEIIVKNQSRGTEMYAVPLKEVFEYNKDRYRFDLIETIE